MLLCLPPYSFPPCCEFRRCWGSQAKGRNGAQYSFLSSLDAHLPWSTLGACLGSPGGAGCGRAGSPRWRWEQGFLQLLGHLAGQLFSWPGSHVWQGCLAHHSLWELHDAKMPGRICQFFWATVLGDGGVALGTWNLQTDGLQWLLSLDKYWPKDTHSHGSAGIVCSRGQLTTPCRSGLAHYLLCTGS